MQAKIFDSGISERFKYIRKKLGLTQAQLASKLRVKQSAVSKIENRSKQLDNSIQKSLVELFQININWILAEIGPEFIVDHSKAQILDPDPEIAELMEGARSILTSGNRIAFDALERNIRYFDHAIAAEKRADESDKKILKMEKRLAALEREKCKDNSHCPGEQSPGEKAA